MSSWTSRFAPQPVAAVPTKRQAVEPKDHKSSCPICGGMFLLAELERHASQCFNPSDGPSGGSSERGQESEARTLYWDRGDVKGTYIHTL